MLSSRDGMGRLTIGIDFRPALSRMTGVGRYVAGLISGLARIDRENRYILFTSSLRERRHGGELPSNFAVVDRRIPVRVLNLLWHRMGRPSLDRLCGLSVDVAHSPHPLILPSRKARSVVTIHDLYFFHHPDETVAEIRRDYAPLTHAHAHRADAVVVVSEATRRDVESSLSVPRERIAVIPNGIDLDRFLPRPEEESRIADKHRLPKHYILAVATTEPRKNVPLLIEAVALMVKRGWDGSLLLAGADGADILDVERRIARWRLSSRVRRLGYVPPEDLPALYRRARTLVMPSRWEGFGLPLLEAMACGTPIVASDIPAHREVAEEAACYCDAYDPASMADALETVWDDESLRRELVKRGSARVGRYSWDEAARKTLALYRRLGDGL